MCRDAKMGDSFGIVKEAAVSRRQRPPVAQAEGEGGAILCPDRKTGRWSGGGRSRKTCAVPICERACNRAVFRRYGPQEVVKDLSMGQKHQERAHDKWQGKWEKSDKL
jgi:hypothetical protein